ncbi:MAG: ATP-binding protein [Gammaproteobacteria bacterium]
MTALRQRDSAPACPRASLTSRFRSKSLRIVRAPAGTGGLGLGLPLVKHVVELHGGEVRAKRAGLGQGTCLTVDLPVGNQTVPNAERSSRTI